MSSKAVKLVSISLRFLARCLLLLYLISNNRLYAVDSTRSEVFCSPVCCTNWRSFGWTHSIGAYPTCLLHLWFSVSDILCLVRHVQNTRFLQMVTMAIRNIAFIIMIALGFLYVGKGNGTPVKELPLFNFSALPGLFGTAVYRYDIARGIFLILCILQFEHGTYQYWMRSRYAPLYHWATKHFES